jgi:hypothetical protein
MISLSQLETAEVEARRAIRLALGPLLKLAEEVNLLLIETLESAANNPRRDTSDATDAIGKVCLILGARLANGLRACSILSDLGYGLQAMGIAASLVEDAGTLAYIGSDESRAIDWAGHSDKGHAYPARVKDGLTALAEALGVSALHSQSLVDRWYGIYRDLCMAKHGNPLLALRNGLRFDSDGPFFGFGPDGSRFGIETSYRALYQATLFSLEGTDVCINSCGHAAKRDELHDRVKEMMLEVNKAERALQALMKVLPRDDE